MPTRITLALDRYDRHVPFFLGQLSFPPDIDLVPLEVGMVAPRRHGIDRHRRMLRLHEFDAAEVSLASYIIAKDRGAPFTAIPVFPRRLFSQNHIFVSESSGISRPAELAGKRVVVWAFQVTMSVLAKGDMRRDYGLDWRKMQWLTLSPEEIPVPNLPVRLLPPGSDPAEMLLRGEADAFIYPHPPAKFLSGRDGIRRLFPDPEAECRHHFARRGFFPIMHLIAIKKELADAHPSVPQTLMRLWEEAKAIANDFYHDPGYGLPAFARLGYERQKLDLGGDIWPSGFAANRRNLEEFIEDMAEQALIAKSMPAEALFHASVIGT